MLSVQKFKYPRWFFYLETIVVATWLIALTLMNISYIAGYYTLGHWPRINLDDPKHIEGFSSFFWLGICGLTLFCVSVVAFFITSIVGVFFDRADRKFLVKLFPLVLIVLLGVSYIFVETHPVIDWLLD